MTPLAEQRLFPFADVFPGKIPVSPRTARRLVARGEIGVIRISGGVYIPEMEIERFLLARFTPARTADPQTVLQVLDRVLPKKRGRPPIKEMAR
jgi:hypothetical protein